MMRYLYLGEVLRLYDGVMSASGGSYGLVNIGALESALAQPSASFENKDLYPLIHEKAAALCFSLILNHPFIDGNKRIGLVAMEVFLGLNGYKLVAEDEDIVNTILSVAEGTLKRNMFEKWLEIRIVKS